MWLVFIATLFNAASGQQSVINNVRLTFGPIFVGSMEGIIVVLLAYALIFGGSISRDYPNQRTHPALTVLLALWILAIITGTIGSFVHHVDIPDYLRTARELGAWPLYVIVGYRILGTPKAAYRFMYVLIIAGTCTATILLMHFGENAEQAGLSDNLNAVRAVQYMNPYAGMAAMVLIYSMISGIRLMPTMIAMPLACYCLVGQCAPLHRGEWMAMMFCSVLMLTLIDRRKIVGTVFKGVIVVVLLFGGMIIAVNIAGKLMHRDFGEKVQERLISMLPIERQTTHEGKAWDTRLASTWAELAIWEESPLFGQGYSIQGEFVAEGKILNYGAFNHNGWASVLCQTGLIGFVPSMMFVASLLLIGRKLVVSQAYPGTMLMGALAVMSAGYMVAGILAGIIWTIRMAMLFGLVCGMAYRCLSMQESCVVENMPETRHVYGDDEDEPGPIIHDESFASPL